ncbi:hypothetical protein ZWY2020_040601 [Hordeum vulgare]|nr:hypothetical protein ZWY2020_040601 [Hordeum vulgare]
MKLAASSLATSSPIAFLLCAADRRRRSWTGRAMESTCGRCSANSLGTPGMSQGFHAKMSQFSRRNWVSTLIIAEHEGGLINPSSLSALAAAEVIAKESKVSLLLGGSGPTLHKAAQHVASSHPLVNEVLVEDSDVFAHPLPEPWAEMLRSMQQKGGYSHVIASSTSFGKKLLPRAVALLDVSPVTDVTAISEPRVFVRPIYAGNALCTVLYTGDSPCMTSIRSTSFSPPTESTSETKVAPITQVDLSFLIEGLSSWPNKTQDSERLTRISNHSVKGFVPIELHDSYQPIIFIHFSILSGVLELSQKFLVFNSFNYALDIGLCGDASLMQGKE